jgi:hypothetical protein
MTILRKEPTGLRRPRPGWVPALILLAAASPAALAGQEPERADLPLLVVEAETARPLAGAVVRIPELDLALVTNGEGLVVFRDVPVGRHPVEVEHFGYLSASVPVTIPRSSPFRVSIAPAPVVLEGIVVEADNAMGLGERRDAIPLPVEVLRSVDLVQAGGRITHALASRGLELSECPEGQVAFGERTPWCVRFEGRWVRPHICIDERWIPAEPAEVDKFRPIDIHTLELYRGGAYPPRVIVLGYTHGFVTRSLETGRTVSRFVNCAGAPDEPPDPSR